MSAGRTANCSRCADLAEHRVAGGVAEAVIDRLEVVEVDEHHADLGTAAARPEHRVLDAVGEERPVGEARHGVVERLVCELVLELLPLADVAPVEHDAADVLVLEEVGVLDLELEPRAVAMLQAAVDHVGLGASADVRLPDAREDLHQARLVRWSQQLRELGALDLVDPVAEHAGDRGALVGHRPVRVEHGDQVAGVRDERAEARLAPPPVEVLRQ